MVNDARAERFADCVAIGEVKAVGCLPPRLNLLPMTTMPAPARQSYFGGERADGSGTLNHDNGAEAMAGTAEGVAADYRG